MENFSAAWLWDNSASAYVNNTNSYASSTASDLWGQTADYLYLGLEREMRGGVFTLTTNGSYGAFTYAYWNGSAWTTIIPLVNYTFNTSKYFLINPPADWQPRTFNATDPHTASVPDSISRYWLRISTASVTTTSVATRCYSIPEISYATPTLVYQLLQFKQDFTNTGTPSRRAVIELIKRAESKIDYRTRKSWRWNVENTSYSTQIQLFDYNRWGISLRKWPVLDLYSVAVWNGGSFETLVSGRDQDYFIDNASGLLYLSRMFLLPATYGLQGRYFLFGAGEYKRAIQVEYSYGRNPNLDYEQFGRAQDAATKLAAVDVLTTADYSNLVSSGVDKLSFESKIIQYKADIEENLDQLTGIAIW